MKQLFEHSKSFPKEETYLPIRFVGHRDLYAQILLKHGKRRYEAAFIAKLNDAEGEAAETQTWIEFGVAFDKSPARELYRTYDDVIGKIVTMIATPEQWVMPTGRKPTKRA